MKKISLLLLMAYAVVSFSQDIDMETKVSIFLDDDTEVILYGKAKSEKPSEGAEALEGKYYYLPPANSLRLADLDNGKKQLSLIKYSGNKNADIEGGILSLVLEFGLTSDQELELQNKLKEKIGKHARIMGSIQLMPKVGKTSGELTVLFASVGESSLLSRSSAPTSQRGRIAVIAKLDHFGTQAIEDLIRRKSTSIPLNVSLDYSFPTYVSGYNASLTFEEDKFHKIVDKLNLSYTEIETGKRKKKSASTTWEEIKEFYEILNDEKVINGFVRPGAFIDEESKKAIESGFFNFFFSTFAAPDKLNSAEYDGTRPDIDPTSQKARNETYNLDFSDTNIKNFSRISSFNLNYRHVYRQDLSISGSLSEWAKKLDPEKHIDTIIFGDPFFQHRIITVELDGELTDQIGKEINSIEVKLRKAKKGGGHYVFGDQDPIIFDKNKTDPFIRTYNRSHDAPGQEGDYEYLVNINYRGGLNETIPFKKGKFDRLTVSPKLRRKEIRFTTDLEELKANNCVAAVLEVCYLKFGKERIDQFPLYVDEENSSVTNTIYMDDYKKAYAARVVVYHKNGEVFPLSWKERNNYPLSIVSASIPPQIIELNGASNNNSVNKEFKEILNQDGTLHEEVKAKQSEDFDWN